MNSFFYEYRIGMKAENMENRDRNNNLQKRMKKGESFSWLQDSPNIEAGRLLALKKRNRQKRLLFSGIAAMLIVLAAVVVLQETVRPADRKQKVVQNLIEENERLQELEELLVFAKIHELRPELVVRKLEPFLADCPVGKTVAEEEKYRELLYVYQMAEEQYYTALRDEKALAYYLSLQEPLPRSGGEKTEKSGEEEEMMPDEETLLSADRELESRIRIRQQ